MRCIDVIKGNKFVFSFFLIVFIIGLFFLRSYFFGSQIDLQKDLKKVNGELASVEVSKYTDEYELKLQGNTTKIYTISGIFETLYYRLDGLKKGQQVSLKEYEFDDEDGSVYELSVNGEELISLDDARKILQKEHRAGLYCGIFFSLGSLWALWFMMKGYPYRD